jgi:hypothetical protein
MKVCRISVRCHREGDVPMTSHQCSIFCVCCSMTDHFKVLVCLRQVLCARFHLYSGSVVDRKGYFISRDVIHERSLPKVCSPSAMTTMFDEISRVLLFAHREGRAEPCAYILFISSDETQTF